MEAYNYDEIIDEMVEELTQRVEDGYDVCNAASEIVDGSEFVIWTRHHYKILDMCSVDPAEVVSEFGIDFGIDFDAAIAQTVFCCLYQDVLDAYNDITN